ncbi:DUF6772 family protein [uncultured Algimonas sp.]|uniref:DUF6772 family protein n=1 Tax=uncultured Algimonas sp. TaxID=1547920 RepID=UPI0026063F1A|nr:DUF6772 family protein [uncultured Algimonas sp.]
MISMFEPLPRVLFHDAFDGGLNGWTQLIGNYDGDLKNMLPGYRPIMPPMLSNLSHWDTGSHGSLSGNYALKIATKAKRDVVSVSLKRLTYRHAGIVRLEFYATAKPEASDLALLKTNLKSFGFLLDTQSGEQAPEPVRAMPHLRYLNADNGGLVERWQYKPHMPEVVQLGDRDETVSVFHLEDDGWINLKGGGQRLCYNEIATKVNWHYFRFDFDLDNMSAIHFQCNDRVFDLSNFQPIEVPAMPNLWCMLNICFFVETNANVRSYLYIDSVCLSGEA